MLISLRGNTKHHQKHFKGAWQSPRSEIRRDRPQKQQAGLEQCQFMIDSPGSTDKFAGVGVLWKGGERGRAVWGSGKKLNNVRTWYIAANIFLQVTFARRSVPLERQSVGSKSPDCVVWSSCSCPKALMVISDPSRCCCWNTILSHALIGLSTGLEICTLNYRFIMSVRV